MQFKSRGSRYYWGGEAVSGNHSKQEKKKQLLGVNFAIIIFISVLF